MPLSNNNEISLDTFEILFDKIESMYIAVDIVGNIHFINSFGAQKLGFSSEELNVKSLLSIVSDNDKKLVRECLFRLADQPMDTIEWKDRKIDKNGDVIPFQNEASFITTDCDAFILIHCIAVSEADNTKVIAVKQNQIRDPRLQESEYQYSSFFDHHPDVIYHINQLILNSVHEGIYGLDLQSNVIFWNIAAEKMTGYQQEAFASKNLHDLIHHTDSKGEHVYLENCPIYQSLHSGTSIHVQEDIFWREDGTSFPVEYITNPIMVNGHFVGAVVTFKDITEKKKTEELIHNSDKLKAVGQLAAGIAHEIRNPLTSLKGFLQLTQSDVDQKQEYYKIMKEELNRIEIILSELLLLAKPQAAVYEQKDVRILLLNVITLLDTQAIMSNVQIQSKFHSDGLFINCDPNQMKQVFINLIKNAIEAMTEGGEVIVEASRQNDTITIEVVDQGAGIPEEKLGMLGQPFFSTKEKGTGLGLMVSYSIIENHQGKVSVHSRVGEGTTFTVTLPAL